MAKPERWEVYIPKIGFEKIRSDARLAALLRLARIVNALNFCFRALLQSNDEDTPAATRQHINSFLFACGILYEGIKVAKTLGKHFGDRESFKQGLAQLLKDKETKKLQETALNSMRNKIVFHYDEDAVTSTLSDLDLKSYIFASGYSPKTGETYYTLADEIAINFIIGAPGSKEEEDRIFRETLTRTVKVVTEFVRSSDALIADVLADMKWRGRKAKQDN
jgi:hypothetical protein